MGDSCLLSSAAAPTRRARRPKAVCCAISGTVCAFGDCQAYAATQLAARKATAAHSEMENAVDTTKHEQCYFVETVLGMRECDAKQLSLPKRRAEVLEEADQDIAYEVRGLFGISQSDADRAGYDTRWVRLRDLLETIDFETLDEALGEYERSVHHRMKRARLEAHDAAK